VKRRDVVLAVAPDDLGKPRPGVVVQADELGEQTTGVLVCPMSSDIRNTTRTRPVVDPSPSNGLRLRSQIMTDRLVSVRRDRIKQVIGSLDAEIGDQLDRALLVVLGLAR
jgi:mRNA interferase MazF